MPVTRERRERRDPSLGEKREGQVREFISESCRCRQVLTEVGVKLPAIGDGTHGTAWPDLHDLHFTPHSEAVYTFA